MEFLDNGATYGTSIVTKMTFPIIKNTYTTILYTHDVSKVTAAFLR